MRADAAALIAEFNDRAPSRLSFVGVAEHGESGGAVYVRCSDGHDAVLTRYEASLRDLERTADVLHLARSRGLPVPRYELIVPLTDGVAVVQERLPGNSIKLIDSSELEAILEINERFEGVLSDRLDVPVPDLRLQDHEWQRALDGYSDAGRQLVRAVRDLGDPKMVGVDMVHPDLVPDNVLFDERGSITGIVDWDSRASRGDRRFALVKLRFELAWGALYPPTPDPGLAAQLDQVLDTVLDPDTLRTYWAHWSLRMANWTIRNHHPADVDLHLNLAASRLL